MVMPMETHSRPKPPANGLIRRCLRWCVRLGVVVVGIEVLLQLASFGVWLANRKPARAEPVTGKVVLCVGDSFTFGQGATDPLQSYPSRLESFLRAGDSGDWSVVNDGWPGRDSREVVLRLPQLLEKFRPEAVLVMVGANDGWSRPEAVTPGEVGAGEGFPWRIRTLRLLALLRHGVAYTPTPAETTVAHTQAPAETKDAGLLIGGWNYKGQAVEFNADGSLRSQGWTGSWSLQGPSLVLQLPFDRLVLDWNVEGTTLTLAGSNRLSRFQRGLPPPLPYAERLEQALREVGEYPVFSKTSTTMRQKISELADQNPDIPDLRALEGWQAYLAGDDRAAVASARQALALAAEGPEASRELAMRTEALSLSRSGDVQGALRVGLSWFSTTGDEHDLSLLFTATRGRLTREEIVAALENSSLEDEQRQTMWRLFDTLVEKKPGTGDVTEHHLRTIASLCKKAGSRAIFLSYPFRAPDVSERMTRIASAGEADFLDVYGEGFAAFGPEDRKPLFVADGHCSDQGYEIIANLAARRLRGLPDRDPAVR